MRSLWIVLRFIVLGTGIYALKHHGWSDHGVASIPLRVTVAATASPRDVEAAITSAILLDTAVQQGSLVADPVVRVELLRSMRALPNMQGSDERTMLAEAVRLDLHSLDPVVRERLRFAGEQILLSGQAETQAADAELRVYFEEHAERYREPGSFSVQLLHELPMLPTRLLGATASALAQRLGAKSARAIEALDVGAWSEPLMTPYGVVLARMLARSPAELPAFTRVRERVASDFAHDRRARRLADVLRSTRERRAIALVRTP